ncbi:MAG: hypothetical protein LH632_19335 [Rhodoferax sp.]|nr:hypothetical protein [Rhodoferax sp.]
MRNDLLVVGTNAFAADAALCALKFPAGNAPTEDFDLAWCRAYPYLLQGPDSNVVPCTASE